MLSQPVNDITDIYSSLSHNEPVAVERGGGAGAGAGAGAASNILPSKFKHTQRGCVRNGQHDNTGVASMIIAARG